MILTVEINDEEYCKDHDVLDEVTEALNDAMIPAYIYIEQD